MDSAPETSFYLTRKGALSGPFALQTLQRLVSAGEIAPDDQVRAEDAREWMRAADHPALARELAARVELLAQLDASKPARFPVTLPPPSAHGWSSEQPSLEPTMMYVRAQPRRPRAVITAALFGIALGLAALIGVLRLVAGARQAPSSATVAAPAVMRAPSPPAAAPPSPPSLAAAPSTAAPGPSRPPTSSGVATAAPAPAPPALEAQAEPASASSVASLALLALRRAARQCGQGEPNASAELHVDADGQLSSLRARGVLPETVGCLERAARPLSFGAATAPRVLSLSLPLRAARATGEPALPTADSPAPIPSAAASARSAPPPLINPYHR